MRTVTLHLRADESAPIPSSVAALALTSACRHRDHSHIHLADGSELALELTPGSVLQPGDHLQTEDGAWFEVIVEPEPVLKVCAADPSTLIAAAYHLGNRHVPAQIFADHLLLGPDPVLQMMLEGLGADVEESILPFAPERGAYAGDHRHGHQDSFNEDEAFARLDNPANARVPVHQSSSVDDPISTEPPVDPLFGADADA